MAASYNNGGVELSDEENTVPVQLALLTREIVSLKEDVKTLKKEVDSLTTLRNKATGGLIVFSLIGAGVWSAVQVLGSWLK